MAIEWEYHLKSHLLFAQFSPMGNAMETAPFLQVPGIENFRGGR
jgi:hypothetical protein